MDNIKLWDSVKSVPSDSKKKITGGRLNGMTDVKPQWRLQVLTEQFGPCGVGWFYKTTDRWEDVEVTKGTISCHVRINLYIKYNGEWSEPIEGNGGSMLVASEKAGLYHSDEAYKMATTDALSVACKQLGIAADVYMGWPEGRPASHYPEAEAKLKGCLDVDELIAAWENIFTTLDKSGREALLPIYAEVKAKLS